MQLLVIGARIEVEKTLFPQQLYDPLIKTRGERRTHLVSPNC